MTGRPTPFNTGKVLIGRFYEPARTWTPSRDAYDLQTALLARPGARLPWPARLGRWLSDLICGRPV